MKTGKIIKFVIFAVAIIACLLSIWFAAAFDQDKMANYNEATVVNQNNPAMIDALLALTPEKIPAFVEQYRTEGTTLSDDLKAQQLQKDILYTYITDLNELTDETFPEYQEGFAERSVSLFAKADDPQHYVDGFNGVKAYENLTSYANQLTGEYRLIKQSYLDKKAYVKSFNSIVNQVDAIGQVVSDTKKAEDLQLLQADVNNYMKSAKLLNLTVVLGYVLGFLALGAALFFAIVTIVSNIKTSYKVIIVLVAAVILFVVFFFLASPAATPSSIKEKLVPAEVKWLGAGMFMCYTVFFGAICAIIGTSISNAIKNR